MTNPITSNKNESDTIQNSLDTRRLQNEPSLRVVGKETNKPLSPSIHRRPRLPESGKKSLVEVKVDPYEAAKGAHAIVVCTEWDEFR
jgi:hypothetical protein